ncbi:MAG: hypothetical protein LOD91_11505, partial [Limnochordales bacterium]
MAGPGPNPRTVDDVLAWLSAGRISSGEALVLFQRLETRAAPPAPAGDGEADGERQRRLEAVMAELDALIGLAPVKELVRELAALVKIQRRRAAAGLSTEPMA